jgi:hypothetical protein
VLQRLSRAGRPPSDLSELERAVRRTIAALLQQGRRRITYEILARFLAADKEFPENWDPDLHSINATRLKDRLKYRRLSLRRLILEEKTRLGLNG